MFTTLMKSAESGKIFEQRRLSIGKTQEQVAAEVGVSVKTIQNVESGRTQSMRLGSRVAYAASIGMPFDELQRLMTGEGIESIGQAPRLRPSTIAQLEAWRAGGPEPSPEAQAEFDAVEKWFKELRSMERQGSMRGK